MKNTFTAREEPDLEFVWTWFEFQSVILSEADAHLDSPIEWAVAPRGYESQFFGWSQPEIQEFVLLQHEELNMLTMFELLATVEAILRLDFQRRVRKRLKDPVSREFQRIGLDRARLDEDILETWKRSGNLNVGGFRSVLRLRHWLAHGRHWHPKLGRGFKPVDVYTIAAELLAAVHPLP